MKFINVPISVEARKGVPRRLRWGRRIYTVRRLLDFWILQSRWWAREEKRVYFRLETDRGVVEVYRGGGEKEERRGSRSEPTHGAKRSKGEEASKTHRGGHPPFVEGDTHTRELRQTESPYRPDAAALADRRFKKPDLARPDKSDLARPDKPHLASRRAAPAAEDSQSAPMSHPCGTSSSDSSRRAAPQWVLSKIMD